MAVRILRRGSEGKDVERWQMFLVGQGHMRTSADGEFGPQTEKATKAFQRAQGLGSDGIVGPQTLAKALALGFDLGFIDPQRGDAESLLPEASSIKPIASMSARQKHFGKFEFKPAPTSSNTERIRILGDWEDQNIKTVFIPQLKGISVFGQRSSGKMRFHQAAEEQLEAMWAAWEEAGVVNCVLTYEGSYNPRFIRGSRTRLSNHAFGSAFDINAKWNRLGTIPTAAGREGSVLELVDIANEHGFFWGGHFKGRPDGMHFEIAKLL
jgi:hypothetical protein